MSSPRSSFHAKDRAAGGLKAFPKTGKPSTSAGAAWLKTHD